MRLKAEERELVAWAIVGMIREVSTVMRDTCDDDQREKYKATIAELRRLRAKFTEG
ncbi:hypothetical protein [Streptomyces sp. NPDC002644]